MFRIKIVLFTLAVTFAHWTSYAPDADAGLLRDWLNRRRARRAQAIAPLNAAAYNGHCGLQPGQCQTTCQQTCSRVVVNYVPCTSYRTTYERVPVTQYRPQTTSDPCTGCSVTCMRPCTTYTYRTRRVPYTTYRPVYRTETYKVPVTTITNDCNTCGIQPSTCSTCATGVNPFVGQPLTGQTVTGGTISTNGNYELQPGTPLPGATITPADGTPTINPENSNRSVIESLNNSGSSTRTPIQQPGNWTLTSTVKPENQHWNNGPATNVASASPVTKKWNYSPIKQASYVSVEADTDDEQPTIKTFHGKFNLPETKTKVEAKSTRLVNEGWETVKW